jgi:fatty acid desaturase
MLQWIAWILIDIVANWYWIEKRKKVPNYVALTIIRGWAFIAAGISIGLEPIGFIPFLVYCLWSFWVFFDLGLNIMRGKKWNYLGENSFTDSIGKEHPTLYWVSKVVGAVITLYYFIFGL